MNWEFQRNVYYSNTWNRTKKPGREGRTTYVQASTIQPCWRSLPFLLFSLLDSEGVFLDPYMLRSTDPNLSNQSHVLLAHNAWCKSAPPRMFLYLLANKMNSQSENTTSVVRQDDYFSLCGATYLPGNTSSYKSWRVTLHIALMSLLPEKMPGNSIISSVLWREQAVT